MLFTKNVTLPLPTEVILFDINNNSNINSCVDQFNATLKIRHHLIYIECILDKNDDLALLYKFL